MTREEPATAAFKYLKRFVRKTEKDILSGPAMIGEEVTVLN